MFGTIRQCFFAVAVVALAGGQARADLVLNYSISGRITGATGVYSSLHGDLFSGTFSYDVSIPPSVSGPGFAEYATGALDYTVGSNAFSFSSDSSMRTEVLYHFHGVTGLFSMQHIAGGQAAIDLVGGVTSTLLPDPLPVSGFTSKGISYSSGKGRFSGIITEMKTLVPEPPTVYGALVLSLVAAGYVWGHRRHRAPAGSAR
jgi:hypothetical protein